MTSSVPLTIASATRPVSPALTALLQSLKPGQRIRVTQTVRVGQHLWTATIEGSFRAVNHLATGLATDRAPDEGIVVAMVHFTKDNGELSSIALDEQSKIEVVGSG